MIKKFSKIISILLCFILVLSLATACGGGIEYTGGALKDGNVGTEYSQSVATAVCAGKDIEINYALKEGSTLPSGLALSADGTVSGTPREKTDNAQFTVVASADGKDSVQADFTLKIKEGKIAYAGSSLQLEVNKEGSVSVATATGASSISYALKEGSALPTGLSLASDGSGTLSGTPVEKGEYTFTVVATAKDCTPGEATFTLAVTDPMLVYEGIALANGRETVFYSANIATATGAASGISYALKSDSTLPEGLTLTENGLISGVPAKKISRHKFTVIASADGYVSAEAEFTLTILVKPNIDDADAGTITYREKNLKDVYAGEDLYIDKAVASASSDNRQTVSYALKTGSNLPEGLTLLPDGTIHGTTSVAGDATFTVVASAPGCADVEATFTLKVLLPRIIFVSRTIEMATINEAYECEINDATVAGNAKPAFTYALKEGTKIPAGLTLSAAGKISGTPTQMVRDYYITVVVSADGYTSATASLCITVQDTIKEGVKRFEAEYWDLTGLVGGGWSGSAQGTNMIQDGGLYSASNDKYVGWTFAPLLFHVDITSSAAVNGVSFYLGADTEIGDITIDNSTFDIRINGESVSYSLTIESSNGSQDSYGQFRKFLISSDVSLKEGVNRIEIEVKENTLLGGGRTGAPGLDYIEFDNLGSASLSWRPKTINLL